MVPVLANGFSDLVSRRNWQEENQVAQQTKLREVEARITNLLTRQDLDVSTQLQVIQRQQLRLTLRTLGVMRKVETARRTGMKIGERETQLMGRIQEIAQKLTNRPLGVGNIKQMETKVQSLAESERLDPLMDLRSMDLTDGDSLSILQSVASPMTWTLICVLMVCRCYRSKRRDWPR